MVDGVLLRDAERETVADLGEGSKGQEPRGGVQCAGDPNATAGCGSKGGLDSGSEESGGEDAGAVERETKEGLVGCADEWR